MAVIKIGKMMRTLVFRTRWFMLMTMNDDDADDDDDNDDDDDDDQFRP